jgi:hypothetical protein
VSDLLNYHPRKRKGEKKKRLGVYNDKRKGQGRCSRHPTEWSAGDDCTLGMPLPFSIGRVGACLPLYLEPLSRTEYGELPTEAVPATKQWSDQR